MSSEIFISYTDNTGESNFFELTCSTNVGISYRDTVTSSPVESGSNIVDHVKNDPVKISIGGLLTKVVNYNLEYFRSPDESIKELQFLRSSRQPFTVNVDDSLDNFENCVFTSMSITKSSGQGSSWNVELGIQQVDLVETATISDFAEQDETTEKQHSSKSNQGDANTEQKDSSSLANISSTVFTLGSDALKELSSEDEEGGD